MKCLPDDPEFLTPPSKYRGFPFWAWNSSLDKGQLLRQIDIFREMGFGGFHMHSRTGLSTPYLGEEFLARVRDCVAKAEAEGLLAWLYDEDRWPSGFAGGMVTCLPQYRMRHVLFTRQPYCGIINAAPNISCAEAGRLENGQWLASYSITLRDGFLKRYRRIQLDDPPDEDGVAWHAYLESTDGVPWFNGHSYVDVLNPRAIRHFLELTHETYRDCVGEHFGTVVPAIFTDEPQHVLKGFLKSPDDGHDLVIPATEDFFSTYRETFGEDLLDCLPEIFWELPEGAPSRARYRYHDHVTERFSTAFAGTLGRWCAEAGIMLTGHMMEERTLQSQTRAIGDAMRSLSHFQLPGIDLLSDRMELTTAKQAQSISRQFGRTGVLSELYGVTGWDFSFAGYKAQGDWQAAMGVNVRVPHLSWLSMAGESKRDFPASIHYQSPWWREFKLIEDHFARVNVCLGKGRPAVRVAVVHPIESLWLCYGNSLQTGPEREQRDRQFLELPQWLLFSLIDFDYLCEALLPGQYSGMECGALSVGCCRYEAVIVPNLRTIRSTTLEILEEFVANGGFLVFAGEVPDLVDASPSDRPRQLAERSRTCPWDRDPLTTILDGFRDIRCINEMDTDPESLLYQLREDGPNRHLFICNTDRDNPRRDTVIEIGGTWEVFNRDTGTGLSRKAPASVEEGKTFIHLDLEAHGHSLLTLVPGIPEMERPPGSAAGWDRVASPPEMIGITLEEPNVLLLDQAEWKLGDGPWNEAEEILRIGSLIRKEKGLLELGGDGVQPWADRRAPLDLGQLDLRFTIESETETGNAWLALEDASAWSISLDGIPLPATKAGWWVDEAVEKVKLPPLRAGIRTIVISRPLTSLDPLEWCYLLGSFGVRLDGRRGVLTPPVRKLPFGDWTQHGLPFYTGNLTYHYPVSVGPDHDCLRASITDFRNPLLQVGLDGRAPVPVAFAPWLFTAGEVAPGEHVLHIKAFGNRHNAFGPLHNTQEAIPWMGPGAWRTSGSSWTYHYKLRPTGLMAPPVIETQSSKTEFN